MKKIFTIITLIAATFLISINISLSKSLEFVNADRYVEKSRDEALFSYAEIKNISSNQVTVKANIKMIDLPAGYGVAHCWGGQCLGPKYADFTTTYSFTLAPGAQSGPEGFDVSLAIDETAETHDVTVQINFFVISDVTDSIEYTVVFHVLPSVSDVPQNFTSLNNQTYPNPANSYVTLDFSDVNLSSDSKIEILNEIGSTVDVLPVSNNIMTLNTNNYINGRYFYFIQNNKKRTQVQSFVVSH